MYLTAEEAIWALQSRDQDQTIHSSSERVDDVVASRASSNTLKRPVAYLVTQPLRIPAFQGQLSMHSSSRRCNLQPRVPGRSLAIDSSRTEASYASTLGPLVQVTNLGRKQANRRSSAGQAPPHWLCFAVEARVQTRLQDQGGDTSSMQLLSQQVSLVHRTAASGEDAVVCRLTHREGGSLRPRSS